MRYALKKTLSLTLSMVVLGQSIVACGPRNTSVESQLMRRSTDRETDQTPEDSSGSTYESGVTVNNVEIIGRSQVDGNVTKVDFSEKQEDTTEADNKTKAETERVKNGESTGNLKEAEGASDRTRNELMREMLKQTEARNQELRKQLQDLGIDTGDGQGNGGKGSGQVGGDEGQGSENSTGSGSNAGGAQEPSPADIEQRLEKEAESIENAVTSLKTQKDVLSTLVGAQEAEFASASATQTALAAESSAASERISTTGSTGQDEFDSAARSQGETHNTGVRLVQGNLPEPLQGPSKPKGPGTDPEERLPDSDPKNKLKQERRKIDFIASTSSSPDAQRALDHAHDLLDSAARYAAKGDFSRADSRRQAAARLGNLASGMAGRNLDGAPSSDGLDRGQVRDVGFDLYSGASELDAIGLGAVADVVIENAGSVLSAAYEATRLIGAVDLAASTMEAFAGKTLDFDDDGSPVIRDTTTIERAIAVIDLGLTVGGGLVAGPAGVIAAGVITDIGKAIVRKEGKKAAKEAAEKAAKKGLGAAEKEAAEKAAKEAAEKKAKKTAETASDAEKNTIKTELDSSLKDKFSKGASTPDRGGLSKAGRALQKHSNRPGSSFPKTTGKPENWNDEGQKVIDSIINDPGAKVIQRSSENGGIFDVIAPDGRGARFYGDGTLKGLLEPQLK